ncbi:50S ribosomal protein L9 [Erythrobacter arachoides]|uniref:Large ribosomal subunit protein bL9 n=1 Tax=Aurantiacibacter arachoides TaxID=1850444 RepID=A0A845A0G9_9SPHN|nr:50S ribosomal protein L9 [Aurantiacibacter arachoides]MXO93448.1 50S ribosomal protein L9 [Aurantiacibacter arachoides]GGD49305.1 50S ribosomal protein L9 [Aurantiacibacter arachoides]
MDIILLQRIGNLGQIGDVVSVKDGYARNFLLPQKKALRANDANRRVFEANRDKLESDNAERRTEAEKQGETVAGEEIVLIRAASNAGQLYGSVNVRDVADALKAKGHDIDKRQVIMGSPIKTIGMFDVTVALHPEVEIIVKANVARSDDEAELQSKGVDILAQAAEDAADARAGEGFQEAIDPDRELGDLPAAESDGDEAEGSEEA